jgi:hypothetical protein
LKPQRQEELVQHLPLCQTARVAATAVRSFSMLLLSWGDQSFFPMFFPTRFHRREES